MKLFLITIILLKDRETNNQDYDVNSLLKEVEKLQKHAATLHLGNVNSTIQKNCVEKQSKK